MSKLAKALTAAAGNAGESLYVEDVFSTYLYDGNGSTQTITNGIDLDGEGGLTWFKARSSAVNNALVDTERGYTSADAKILYSDLTQGNSTVTNYLEATSTGFNLLSGSGGGSIMNGSGINYASWTFRKAEKFFDVVTYTGTGSGIKVVDHNLGSAPAVIVVKKTNSSQDWLVFSKDTSQPHNKYLKLNTTDAELNYDNIWGENGYLPTDTQFKVQHLANESSSTYVAYLFASDAGGFGDDGSENIIKCGSYVGTGASGNTVDFGFEPQWVLIKNTQVGTKSWHISDMMRGLNYSTDHTLSPNTSSAEANWAVVKPTATGLLFTDGDDNFNSAHTFIYIAIRRPMKTPESGTEVFDINTADGATSPQFKTSSAGPIDTILSGLTTGFTGTLSSRLTGTGFLKTASTDAELTNSTRVFDYMNGYGSSATVNSNFYGWMFKRATGFFDVVAYTGDLSAGRTVAHNLGVAPELMIIKQRDFARNWTVYHSDVGATKVFHLDWDGAAYVDSSMFDNTDPTSSVFTVDTNNGVNGSGGKYIAYLFATLAGVSKVGSYTGTGSNVDVDCGFSAGARFILIKRTDSTGDWYVWDSVRGIVAGNDPYLLLNSTAAEVTSTDYIDPLSSGFTVTSSAPAALNASGGTYIFLAIA